MLIIFIASCNKDFLELEPQQSVSTNKALVTIGDFQAAITGAYDGLSSSNYYGRYFVLVTDIMSDDVKQNASANRAADWAEYVGSSTDNNNLAENIWQVGYQVINRTNRIILTEATVPEAVQADLDNIKGEAYAIRALVHFDLVRIYAQHYTFTSDAGHPGVPIVTEIDPFMKPARNTVMEVYDQVISDFNTALGLIGDSPNSSTLSATAVKALLSRVYLYKEDWTNAVNMADAVINSGDYSLVSNANHADIFMQDNSSESIFEMDMNPTDRRGTDALGGMYLGSGYGDYLPSEDLINLIPEGDARGNLFAVDSTVGGGIYGYLRVNKYASVLGEDNTKIIRLSEVYLNRAEAQYHLNNEAKAKDDVNKIRKRGLPSSPNVTASGAALLDEILLERRLELCYEGHRLWDLTRNKRGVYRNDCTATICSVKYPDSRFILAIGQYEIDVNTNVTQNPGY